MPELPAQQQLIEFSETWSRIVAVATGLDERKQRALICRYGLNGEAPLTWPKVGERLGVSRERARQLVARAEGEIRAALGVVIRSEPSRWRLEWEGERYDEIMARYRQRHALIDWGRNRCPGSIEMHFLGQYGGKQGRQYQISRRTGYEVAVTFLAVGTCGEWEWFHAPR